MEPAENTVHLDLVEYCKLDDDENFSRMVKTSGSNIDVDIPIRTCPIGSNTPMVLMRTPLMIAAIYRSQKVVQYILESGLVNVDKPSPSDGATAIECAYSAVSSPRIIEELLTAPARRKQPDNSDQNHGNCALEGPKFMMFTYKVESCKKGCKVESYGSCPYLHPNENARRDLREHFYKTKYCSYYGGKKGCRKEIHCSFSHGKKDSKKGCRKEIHCSFSHGKKERQYHPFVYRTRDCQNGTSCKRPFCPHAHNAEEKRNPDPYAQLKEEKRRRRPRTLATNIDANNTTAPSPTHGQGGSTSGSPENAFVNDDEADWQSLMDDIALVRNNMMDLSGAN